MYKLWTHQLKFNDRSSWTESDQAHYFGYRLSFLETKQDSPGIRVMQANSDFQRDGEGMGRTQHAHGGKTRRSLQTDPSSFLYFAEGAQSQ